MSIHFYKKGDTKTSLFHLSDDEYAILEHVFEEFRSKTGIYIDPYGNARLYPANFKLLKTIAWQKFNGREESTMKNFIRFMDSVIAEDLSIDAAGD